MKRIGLSFICLSVCLISCGQQKEKHVFKQYFANGTLMSATETENGKKNGKEIIYYENGNIRALQYFKDNLYIDSFYHYSKSDSGKIIVRGSTKLVSRIFAYDTLGHIFGSNDYDQNGEGDGLVKTYFPDEKIFGLSEYKNTKKNGVDITYFPNGNIFKIKHYENGVVVPPSITFDTLGNVVDRDLVR